jgi:hypothetical protein
LILGRLATCLIEQFDAVVAIGAKQAQGVRVATYGPRASGTLPSWSCSKRPHPRFRGTRPTRTITRSAVFATDSPQPGDYNANGRVEQGDLELVLLHWGEELFNPYAAGWANDAVAFTPPQGL